MILSNRRIVYYCLLFIVFVSIRQTLETTTSGIRNQDDEEEEEVDG